MQSRYALPFEVEGLGLPEGSFAAWGEHLVTVNEAFDPEDGFPVPADEQHRLRLEGVAEIAEDGTERRLTQEEVVEWLKQHSEALLERVKDDEEAAYG